VDAGTREDTAIYQAHSQALVRFATGLVGPSDAADVVASAVLRAMTSKSWPQVTDHKAYLYRAVANEARSQYRSTMRRRAREQRVASREPVYQPDVRPEVLEAVSQLSPRQREVVVLTYWEDLSETAVADRLGMSPGSVRRHLGRARQQLRSLLNE
jgi:RNA polymerase sigma factor (sigma-70 family)